jgi:hypothetical protein
MSNFLEIIQQLRLNQKTFDTNLTKLESLGRNANKSDLRDLIQDARQIHETSVILSYVLFDQQVQKSEQLEIQLQENKVSPAELGQSNTEGGNKCDDDVIIEEPQIISKDSETLNTESKTLFQENDEILTQDQIVDHLQQEISSVISENSSQSFFMNEEEDNSLAGKIARKKIENLIKAIGINEKFLFTNELFDGNTEQFVKTIEELNSCVTFKEANDKLILAAEKRSWTVEEEPYQKLQTLLSRKYQ